MKAQKQFATTYSTRKGAIRSRPGARWMNATEEVDFARSSSWNRANRDCSQDIRSLASVHKIASLLEIFPEVSAEMMEDVLVAAQLRMDLAASMLSEMVRDSQSRAAESVDTEWESDTADLADEQWFDLHESRPELQQWVVVQDEWELVDDVPVKDNKPTLSFAEVLRMSSPLNQPLDRTPTTKIQESVTVKTSLKSVIDDSDDSDAMDDKSFGTRKRRFMRKYRS